MDAQPTLTFDELCAAVDLPTRKVRYYIQLGVVDRPDGTTRWAKYTTRHVEQLLSIKKWQAAGLSLERIRALLHGGPDDLPPKRQPPGTVEVWSRLVVAPGIELNVEAGVSGLSPEELRNFFRKVMSAYQETKNTTNEGSGDE
ncbi:MAG: MerR family transcriptional regulator [Propionivibrio sp.]|nr:MerR family transcriptional regulator [Propionivibrio sp.]